MKKGEKKKGMKNQYKMKPAYRWIFREDLPTEKMNRMSVSNLTDAETIAVILGTGTRRQEATEIAYKLLERAGGSLDNIARMDYREIMKVNGLGEKKAKKIVCAMELGRRHRAEQKKMTKVESSREMAEIMMSELQNKTKEEFWLICINNANRIIKKTKIADGGIHEVIVDPKNVMKEALLTEATGIVVCHNHPSGDITPSEKDIKVTKVLNTGATALGIRLLDHIIVTKDNYFSFADERMLD